MELVYVDPRTLRFNPNNPRRTKASPAADAALDAAIAAADGTVEQPPVATRGEDGALTIVFGERRTRSAIRVGLTSIPVLVREPRPTDALSAVTENTARADLNPVDQWRAIEAMRKAGWTDAGIAKGLAITERAVRAYGHLATVHTPMLDHMARGDMPRDHDLRTIAAATDEEQAAAWKRLKPKKGERASWPTIAHALMKLRLPAAKALFGEAQAAEYGVTWDDDLFAPAGTDGRTTTNVEGFLAAQTASLEANLPERGQLIAIEAGSPVLPKGAWLTGETANCDRVGCYVDPYTGDVVRIGFNLPAPKATGAKAAGAAATRAGVDTGAAVRPERPYLTQNGVAAVGNIRTAALHAALTQDAIADDTLIALLVLAFAASNVSVHSARPGRFDALGTVERLLEGGCLTADGALIRQAARDALGYVLSCRVGHSDSGAVGLAAGCILAADRHLPTMATAEFLAHMTKPAVEAVARQAGVPVMGTGKLTREAMVQRFAAGGERWIYAGARFDAARAGDRTAPADDGAGGDAPEMPAEDSQDRIAA